MKTIPKTSHAQYLVLALLESGVSDGQEIQKALAAAGAGSDKAFYQLMARMEGAGLVKGEYVQRKIDSALSKKPRLYTFKVYAITNEGRKAKQAVQGFYSRMAEVAA